MTELRKISEYILYRTCNNSAYGGYFFNFLNGLENLLIRRENAPVTLICIIYLVFLSHSFISLVLMCTDACAYTIDESMIIHKHRHKRSMLVRTVTLLIDQNPIEIDKRLRITAYSVTKTVFLATSICSFGLMPSLLCRRSIFHRRN